MAGFGIAVADDRAGVCTGVGCACPEAAAADTGGAAEAWMVGAGGADAFQVKVAEARSPAPAPV